MALLFLAIIIFGNMLFKGPGILDAISAYYYSPMRNFFIGSLSVLGTLLICYRYQRVDKIAGIVAGLCVIGLAIFPREPSVQDLLAVCPGDPGQTGTTQEIWAGRAHWAFSIGFLLTIVFMVLYLFTLSEQNRTLIQRQEHKNWFWTIVYTVFRPVMRSDQKTLPLPRRKLWRNRAYLVCGGIMIVFLVLCLIDQVFYSSNLQLESISPVFWCELIPLLAFSVAWFVKGVGIWQDKKAAKVSLTPEVKIT
jgi:magnesium-transporting ATPase (P-type)